MTSTTAQKLIEAAHAGCTETTSRAKVRAGLRVIFCALQFLRKEKRLWSLAWIPALINLVVFGLLPTVFVPGGDGMLREHWPQPAAASLVDSVLVFAWWVARILIGILVIVLSYLSAIVLGGLVSIPFFDQLSLRAEGLLYGTKAAEQSWMATAFSTLRSLVSVLSAALLYFGAMSPVLLVSWLPGVGVLTLPVTAGISGLFLAYQNCDTVFERRDVPVRRRFSLIWENRSVCVGFGIGANLLLWLPIVNLVTLPVVVLGGTCLAISILETVTPVSEQTNAVA